MSKKIAHPELHKNSTGIEPGDKGEESLMDGECVLGVPTEPKRSPLVDRYARSITYLRVSVTDRCNLRCVYCMPEHMTFLPRKELLTIEELDRLCSAFVARGVRKLRLTGGEPLVRRNIMILVQSLSRHLASGALRELTLTTNGSRLAQFAQQLVDAGVRRINVSLDTLDQDLFRKVTRGGDLKEVLRGIDIALTSGLAVKINTVALKATNEWEIESLIRWAHGQGMDLTLIETMPLGDTGEDRTDQYLPLSVVRARLAQHLTMQDLAMSSGGPARYVSIAETGRKLGFITPMTHNFCEGCNRVRVTCEGMLYLCLGQEDSVDLRAPLRLSRDDELLHEAIDQGMRIKPRGHDFQIERGAQPSLSRHMSLTGG